MIIKKFGLTFYKHPTYTWLWFAEPQDNSTGFPIVYTAKLIPPGGSVFIDTGEPQIELKGTIEVKGTLKTKFISSCNKGTCYRVHAHTGLAEAKCNKSDKKLKKRHPYVESYKRTTVADRTAFLNSLTTFDTNAIPDPLRTDGYQLFDTPLPTYYTTPSVKDWSVLKQLPSGIWSIIYNNQLIGGFPEPELAFEYYENFIVNNKSTSHR